MTNSEEFQRWTTLVNQIKALFKKKTLNKQKTIKEEVKQRIKEIEKEQETLKNIERN